MNIVSDKLIVYVVMIIRNISHSEYVDSVFLDKEEAVKYAERLEQTIESELMKVSVEPFTVNELDNPFIIANSQTV